MTTEATIRDALRCHLGSTGRPPAETVDEFWVPLSHERADIAVIGRLMAAFEIKTERDTLRRLPRQAAAYGRIFDRCTVVVAGKHRSPAVDMLPDWWGVVTVSVNGCVTFQEARKARPNPEVDPETLVRLLWRDEVLAALGALGVEPAPDATRSAMWAELLRIADLAKLQAIVRQTLLRRKIGGHRRPSRFTQSSLAAGAGR